MSGHSLPAAMSLLPLSIILLPFSLFTMSSEAAACGIATYWGQNLYEGSITAACDSGNYKYLNIGYLTVFGSDRDPVLNLADHCTPSKGDCKSYHYEIRYCQSRGIKVLLSLGGPGGSSFLTSPEHAREVAAYLWNTYLSGTQDSPLGQVALDGIDLDIKGGSNRFWDDLAKALSEYSTTKRKVYLSASPGCLLPNPFMQRAIETGLFDYVWVNFYNRPSCDIRTGFFGLLRSWDQWSSYLRQFSADTQLFLGLPASTVVASGGYIETDVLVGQILPVIKTSPNYGGVMLWNRYFDRLSGYSPVIHAAVVCNSTARNPQQELLIAQVV